MVDTVVMTLGAREIDVLCKKIYSELYLRCSRDVADDYMSI